MSTFSRVRRAAPVAFALILSACLEVPPEARDPSAPPAAADHADAALADQGLGCDEEFGAANGYLLCAETESTCSFVSESDSSKFDCNERCAEFGTICVSGFDVTGQSCVAESEDGCAFPHETQMCVCLRT